MRLNLEVHMGISGLVVRSAVFAIPCHGLCPIDAQLTVGRSFTFAKLTGANALHAATPAAIGPDFRGMHV